MPVEAVALFDDSGRLENCGDFVVREECRVNQLREKRPSLVAHDRILELVDAAQLGPALIDVIPPRLPAPRADVRFAIPEAEEASLRPESRADVLNHRERLGTR